MTAPARIRPASIEAEARAILSTCYGTASLRAFARIALGQPQPQPFASAPAPRADAHIETPSRRPEP